MGEERSLVSVVMPAFNAERFIDAAIESVLTQDYRHLELIVVDDGSTDATASIADAYAQRDGRVRVLRQPNRGVACARNAGITAARGEFIAPLDADDIWFAAKLRLQVAHLKAAPRDVGVVYAWSAHIDEHGHLTGGYSAADDEGDVYAALALGNFIGNASVTLFRRSCIERCGDYDVTLRTRGGEGCEDTDLYLRFARHYRYARIPRLLVGYRLRADSMSCNWMRMARSHRFVLDALYSQHPGLPRTPLRWARGVLFFYLATQCARSRDHWGQVCCLLRAFYSDPRLWSDPLFQRALRGVLRTVRGASRTRTARQKESLDLDALEKALRARPDQRNARAYLRLEYARVWLSGPSATVHPSATVQTEPPDMDVNRQRTATHERATG